jgi:hypothetical protein
MQKFSALTLTYCHAFTNIQIILSEKALTPGISFELTLSHKKRFVFVRLALDLYVVLTVPRLFLLSISSTARPLYEVAKVLQGLLKEVFLSVAGYALAFKKRFYLSGQVNRLKKLRSNKLILQIGYSHKVKIRSLKYFKFRRWRRKKFGLLIKANNLNRFAAFIDFFRHLRLRGQYTSRGIRLRKDRFKMKFRPDHGKYGFKMNY